MKNKKYLSIMVLGVFALSATAQNPIIQTMYTADPAPMVYNGKCISTPVTMKTSQPGLQ